MNKTRDIYNEVTYSGVKEFLSVERTVNELKDAKKALQSNKVLYDDVKRQLITFVDAYISEYYNKQQLALIKPFVAWEPLKFNVTGLDSVERKINTLKDVKLQYNFGGLLNLLKDERNLIYNGLGKRQTVVDDINKFKTLKFFKVSYVSRFELKRSYGFLSVKGNAVKGHSKLYFIEHGLYVLKTVEDDGLTLKAFYIHNKIKNLLKSSKRIKALPNDDKFNKSSVDAWKTLDNEDNKRFYAYCNANGLDKTNRRLLKSIRAKSGGLTFELYLEQLEENIEELEQFLTSNPYDIDANQELDAKKKELMSLTEEHNSDSVPTYVEDY